MAFLKKDWATLVREQGFMSQLTFVVYHKKDRLRPLEANGAVV